MNTSLPASKAVPLFIIISHIHYKHWYLKIKNELYVIQTILIEKFQKTGHYQGHTVTIVYTYHELFLINISFKFNKAVNKAIKVNY